MKLDLTRRDFLGNAGLAAGAFWSSAAFAIAGLRSASGRIAARERPNILVIVSDDQDKVSIGF